MREIITSTITICLLALIVVLLLISPGGGNQTSPIPEEKIRTLASALEAQGLYQQAVNEYKTYLNVAQIPAEQRANLLYRVGSIYLENLQNYEEALASFLEISHLYPQTQIAKEADKRMVRCFEELQRGGDAQRKLKQLTDLEADDQPGDGPLVAQIGDRKITRDQLERELNQMPENQRKYYEDPENRKQYLQSKLFEELLYDMALRKEYQKDPEVRKQMRRVEKMMLAQKVLNEEVGSKIQISEGDIELYYKANPDEFKTPASEKIAHIQVSNEEKAQEAKKAVDGGMAFEEAVAKYTEDERTKGNGGQLGTVTDGGTYIAGIGQAPEAVQKLMKMEANAVSEPVKTEKGFHIFKVLEKTPEKIPTLEEVKQRVEASVRQRKAGELQEALLQRLLKAETVKIFDQSLVESQPGANNAALGAGTVGASKDAKQ